MKLIDDLMNAKVCEERYSHLTEAAKYCDVSGDVVEMGVYMGDSINHLASLFPDDNIFGFDSFEGIPEDWVTSDKEVIIRGTFSNGGNIPFNNVPADNVTLIKGWFSDSFPEYKDKIGKIKFLHIDSDLYSSAVITFDAFNSHIQKGTIIAFDEFYPFPREGKWYDNWKEGEYKACIEWMEKYNREIVPICRGWSEQCCFIVVK